MNKIVLLASLLFIALASKAQSMYGDAVEADVKMKYVRSFEEALKKAREEKKPVFFNCFADWAVPCHLMNKVVFSDQKFADWMDKHFVNFFIDVTSAEGIPLAEKYDIRTQAHYLVLDGNGEVIYRIVGGHQLPEFQELLAQALDPETTLPEMNRKYANGKRDVKFLRDYAGLLNVAGEPEKADSVADEFFGKLKKSEWCKAENWELYRKKAFGLNDEKFRFMVDHKADFVKHNGLEKIDEAIGGAYWNELYPYTSGKEAYDGVKLLDLYLEMQKCGLPDTNAVYTMYYIVKYRGEKNVDKLLDILENRTAGWDERITAGIDLGLTDMPELPAADMTRIIGYLKKKMNGLKGSILNTYRDAVKVAENPEGVKFEDLTLAEALKKAKEENKFVFMDCYTTWCVPCRNMTVNVFPQKIVGDVFNKHFVNLKVDMEKGEGIDLSKKFDVSGFPTMLVLNADGEVILKLLGVRNAQKLLTEVKNILPEGV